ncbi:MAG: PEP-CTERM sorting domain-containing protein [Deltaproteobacteria bacterium]|nr:PEP-CTERM sorting domain-containing protein [Deltaproteobacteria bacterium]MBW2397970.1 PEP-CTERM sorting domain-containing protein [Deltaproteobacteria bacterium]
MFQAATYELDNHLATLLLHSLAAVALACFVTQNAGATVIDFEGPVNGTELVGNEFAGVTISSSDKGVTHAGPAIFDSSKPGPNDAGADKDLLVNLGNILILQNDALTAQTVTPGVFDTPNDEADFGGAGGTGNLLFTFDSAVEVQNITLIDLNGGAELMLVLTDVLGNTLSYGVPEMWTNDVEFCGFACDGYAVFDLQTLGAQAGEDGGSSITPAPIINNISGVYDKFSIESLEITLDGSTPSAGFDNLTYVPEPGTGVLLGLGLVGLAARRRR